MFLPLFSLLVVPAQLPHPGGITAQGWVSTPQLSHSPWDGIMESWHDQGWESPQSSSHSWNHPGFIQHNGTRFNQAVLNKFVISIDQVRAVVSGQSDDLFALRAVVLFSVSLVMVPVVLVVPSDSQFPVSLVHSVTGDDPWCAGLRVPLCWVCDTCLWDNGMVYKENLLAWCVV